MFKFMKEFFFLFQNNVGKTYCITKSNCSFSNDIICTSCAPQLKRKKKLKARQPCAHNHIAYV